MLTPIPRALCGTVTAMGRPARPAAELAAVREAASLVARETGLIARPAIASEIAARVVGAMLADIECDPDNTLAVALAAVEQQIIPSPINALATCPEIDTASEYVARRVEKVRSRFGRYLSPRQQEAEQESITTEMERTLAHRYLRHLRT